MQNLTVGMVGLRHPHSLGHLRTLDVLPEVARIIFWDPDMAAIDELRGEVQSTQLELAASLADLLAHDDLAFVLAAEQNDRNPDLFTAILAAGHHLLAEKPFGRNAADARRVVDAAHQARRQVAVFYTNRYHPVIRQAVELARGGALGDLYSVELRMLTTQIRSRGPEHWLFDKSAAGGGILSWLGCHYLDLLHELTGDEVESVMAETATRGHDPVSVEDVASLAMRMRSGALASLHAGYVLASSGGGFYDSGYDTHVGVHGREGRLWWDDVNAAQLHFESRMPEFVDAPRRTFAYEFGESRAYAGVHGERFVRDFLAATRGERSSPCPGTAALRVALVTDAAYESARTGARVAVPSLPATGSL